MLDRLRQIAFLVRDLPEAEGLYHRILGLEPSARHELAEYDMNSAVMPAGEGTFIELLQPTTGDSPSARYLARRGETPYLLVFETGQYDRLVPHLKSLGVRITSETVSDGYRSAFVHPGDANGAFLEVVEVTSPDNPWPPAGPGSTGTAAPTRTRQLRQVAILVSDLDRAIQRWSEMFGIQPTRRFQISFTDLEIAVLPLNDRRTFIELAQPTNPDTSSARFLERYGEGVYLTIFEIADSLAVDAYLQGQDIRFTTSRRTDNYVNLGFNSIWLHPASMKGAFIQLSQVLAEENPWPPAGEDWHL
jgi:catechol 2,3-dioxygenase-like lactoylglutathione lyase family enzyme